MTTKLLRLYQSRKEGLQLSLELVCLSANLKSPKTYIENWQPVKVNQT